jgi:hypothetical protein
MGWNDHVDFKETECLDCGVRDTWEFWDDVAKQRYVGRIGQMINRDVSKSDRCPHCGSTRGRPIDESDVAGEVWGY